VASAIFLILMTALATLFNSAVSATRQGYASIEAFETARSAANTITRDLTGAFTSREHGDVYNFYGRPDGFTFVGGLEGGNLGRVTYVFHSEIARPPLVTTFNERWGTVVANVKRQARRVGREMGIYGPALNAEVVSAQSRLEAAYGTHAPEEEVEFDVAVITESLIRLEESGASDLDTFNMYVKGGAGPVVNLDWSAAYVDPIDAGRDTLNAGPPMDANQTLQFQFLMGALDPTPATSGDDLRDLYFAINRTPSGLCPDGGWLHPIPDPITGLPRCIALRILGPETFDQLLKSRKREFWLRMLSDDLGNFTPTELAADPNDGSTGYWYDEGYGVPNVREMRELGKQVLATGIIGSVSVLLPGTRNEIEAVPGSIAVLGKFVAMDLLDADPRFSYGNAQTALDQAGYDGLDNDIDGTIDEVGERDPSDVDGDAFDTYRTRSTYLNYFNSLENLRDPDAPDGFIQATGSPGSIPAMLLYGNLIDPGDLVYVDNVLADNVLGNRTSNVNLGSPLLPRIPSVVTLDFWVTRPKTRPGAPDFRKRFGQSIQIPTAQGREVGSTIALGPGAAL
jgi:hypothetical protein